jgi:phospholipid/cholesterol/gamma-HCH transport system substrate-binding protein
MKVSKEFKVGVLVLLGIVLLYSGVNFLKGNSIFEKDRVYYATFSNSNGIAVSNEVQLNGFKIGMVKSIGLHPKNAQEILVTFSITNDEILIPEGSQIGMISSDLLGTKALSLVMNTEPVPQAKYYEGGDTLTSFVEDDIATQINEQLIPLKKKTEQLIGSVEGIIVSINAFWDTSAAYTIDESLYEFREGIAKFGNLANNLSMMINEEIMVVDHVLNNVDQVTGNLAEKSAAISKTIDNVETISGTLADTDIKAVVESTRKTLEELNAVLAKVNSGEGSIGALLKTDSLHRELLETNQSVQNLLDDMEANPNKYVHFSLFGRKTKN